MARSVISLRQATVGATFAACLFVLPAAGASQSIMGPDTVSFTSGSLTLRGVIYRPAGNGPFPTILFNHGSGKSYTKELAAVGPAYASHGFAFFAPSRNSGYSAAKSSIMCARSRIEKLLTGLPML